MEPAQRAATMDTMKARARKARVFCRSFDIGMASLMDVCELGGPSVEDESERRRGARDWSEGDDVVIISVDSVEQSSEA